MTTTTLLRQDLNLYQAETEVDGSPAWVLHDPSADQFFRLNWIQVQMLGFIDAGTPEAIASQTSVHTGASISSEEADEFLSFLSRHHLLFCRGEKALEGLKRQALGRKKNNLKRLLSQYLYIRIPLWRPDAFIQRTAPWVAWLFHRATYMLIGVSGILGLYLTVRQIDLFLATAINFFSLDRVLIYAAVIIVVKAVHELGHAYAAQRCGCRVRRIGIILLVFFPVLYTDVSDSWRLQRRNQRLLITAGGMLVEGAIACIALFFWSIFPAGTAKDMAFILATASLFNTLLVNLNPLLRFDGYYLLADYWKMPNLLARSLTLVRWHAAKIFLGLADPAPDPPRWHLLLYGWLVVGYRLILTVSIATLIYHLFFKTLAVFLIALMLSKSTVAPLFTFFMFIRRRRHDLDYNRSMMRTIILSIFIAVLLLTPWRGVIRAPAVLQPRAQHTIYAPFDGQLTHLKSETKDRVSSGDVLAIMSSADLEFELQTLKRTIEDIRWQLDVRSFDLILLEQAQILETDYRTNLQRQIALEARLAQGTIRSPISGRVDILDLTLTTGMRLSAGAPLLSVSGEQWHVVAYVAEADLWRIAEQDKARFYANRGGRAALPLQVAGIEEIALQELDSLYPATPFGGTIPVIAGENDTLVPLQAIYRVYLELPADFSPPERVLSGAVTISGKNESLLARFIRHLMGVFRRESGF